MRQFIPQKELYINRDNIFLQQPAEAHWETEIQRERKLFNRAERAKAKQTNERVDKFLCAAMKYVWRCCNRSGSSSSISRWWVAVWKHIKLENDTFAISLMLSRIHKFMFTNVNFNDTLQRYCCCYPSTYHLLLRLPFSPKWYVEATTAAAANTTCMHTSLNNFSCSTKSFLCLSLTSSVCLSFSLSLFHFTLIAYINVSVCVYMLSAAFHNKASRYK